MAFAKKEVSSETNNGKFEKAVAFLNVSVKMEDGSLKQVGGIPLKQSNALHEALLSAEINNLEMVVDLHKVERKTPDDYRFASPSNIA